MNLKRNYLFDVFALAARFACLEVERASDEELEGYGLGSSRLVVSVGLW
jgi:hypothetical protein